MVPSLQWGAMDGHDLLNRQREDGLHQPRRFVMDPGQDVPLVTAALLSARFPVVAPAARLGDTKSKNRGCHVPAVHPPERLRDGGYVENTGLLTIVEVLPALDRAVQDWKAVNHRRNLDVPFIVVSIDDDPAVTDGDPELEEAPRRDLGISVRAGPGYLTRMARDSLESCHQPNVHYVRISPAPHLGAQAATGWELSQTVREEDLAAALKLDRSDRRNAGTQVEKVRAALRDKVKMSCPPLSTP